MSRRLIIECVLLAIASILLVADIVNRRTSPPLTITPVATTTPTVAPPKPSLPTSAVNYSPPISTAIVSTQAQQAPVVYTVTTSTPALYSNPPPSYSPPAATNYSSPNTVAISTTNTVPTESASTGTWSNAPADWPVLTDYQFTTQIPTTSGDALADNSGWKESYGDRGLLSVVPDPTAPLSPSGVLQFTYPVGWQAGSAPGLLYYELPHLRKLYAGFYWKPSEPWQGNDENVNKLVFFDVQDSRDMSDSDLTEIMYGVPGGPYELRIASQIPPVTQTLDDRGPFFGTPVTGNWIHTNVTLGVWHKVEVLADMDASKVEYWLDGIKIGDANYAFPATDSFIEFQFSPTFGGGGSSKSETDYYWFDSVHLAGA